MARFHDAWMVALLDKKCVCRLWLCFSSMQLLMHEVKGIPWGNLCIVLFCLQMYHVLKSFFHIRSLIGALPQILYLQCWCTRAWGLYFFKFGGCYNYYQIFKKGWQCPKNVTMYHTLKVNFTQWHTLGLGHLELDRLMCSRN
jgi:hypothetical protein